MKLVFAFFIVVLLIWSASGSPQDPPPPQSPYHLLLGPYEFHDPVRHLPRYFSLDGKAYRSVDTLKAAIVALPPGSTVYLRGSCDTYDTIDLPPHPISLSDLRAYCGARKIFFTWTFGAGGY